jgi:hypothetical protein
MTRYYCAACGFVGNPAVPCASCDGEEFTTRTPKTASDRAKASPCFDCYFRGGDCSGPRRDGFPREDCLL